MAQYTIPEGTKTLAVRIAPSAGRSFGKYVGNAKRFGGKYNPVDQTWTIQTQTIIGRSIGEFGFVLADPMFVEEQ